MGHSFEYVLAGLKIVGLIGAFAGFSSGEGPHPGRKSRWAFLFLAIAVGAELVDSNMKIQEAREQAERFIRLARPLGSIQTTIFYTISLNDPLVESYRAEVEKYGLKKPNAESQAEAAALLQDTPGVIVFIYKAGRFVGDTTEPDLSFDVRFPTEAVQYRTPTRTPDFESLARSRNYTYLSEADAKDEEGYLPRSVVAQIHDKNAPDDRYSDQEIVSDHDILGATIQISFCPSIFVGKRDLSIEQQEAIALGKLIRFDGVYLEFPGRQELPIMIFDKDHVKSTPSPVDVLNCRSRSQETKLNTGNCCSPDGSTLGECGEREWGLALL
jgi:hypothetical protein